VAAVLIVEMVAVLTEGCAKKAAFADEAVSDEYFIAATVKVPEKGQICANSAMPCDDPDGFRNWLATYEEETDEQEASKEAPEETTGKSRMDGDAADQADAADPEGARIDSGPEEMASETSVQIYRIAGDVIPEEIQTALREALDAEGIGFWYEGALVQIYQESHGNAWAENPNGLDKGLLQYRTTYWPATAAAYGEAGADIFDWQAQVRVYARQTARRINAGLSTDELISRHKTSDDCPALDFAYIQQVRQWLGKMEAIR
jgi:hypothetical protein